VAQGRVAATGQEFESFLQSDFWLEFKARFGWESHRLSFGGDTSGLGALSRSLPLVNCLVYVPHAPRAVPDSREFAELIRGIENEASLSSRRTPLIVRFDLPWGIEEASTAAALGLRKAPVTVQPPSTVIVDLQEDEDALLKGMKSKTRYNVRLAAKRGVTVREAGPEELSVWYRLYSETARRDRISIHSEAYYSTLFDVVRGADRGGGVAGGAAPRLLLYFAEFEGAWLAGNIVLEWGGTATYLYGASSNLRREVMAPYLLQWEAMRQARGRGLDRYDLFGIPPTPDPKHPMHGLYRFKTGFGGRILDRLGAWDYPCRPFGARLYRGAERVRDYYHKVLRKRFG
jgi:lipid II:glycine glycyltransferase (peptidoglycan interpeptide bridge formation enzyme)